MKRLLHISASPKGRASASSQIAAAFLETYGQENPGDEIDTLSVFDEALPEVGRDAAEAKFAPIYGYSLEERHERAWNLVQTEVERLKAADKLVISAPMWNFGIPYKLKQYFDVVVQPGLTFGYDRVAKKHLGLLRNVPTQLILTRSSVMPGDFSDFQLPYLKYVLEFMGVTDTRVLTAWQTTKADPVERQDYIGGFAVEARLAAKNF